MHCNQYSGYFYPWRDASEDHLRSCHTAHRPIYEWRTLWINSLFRFDLGETYIPMAVAAAGLVFVEESLCRGFATPRLSQRFGVIWAVAISSVFFGLLHWGNGVFLSGFFLWRRNLLPVSAPMRAIICSS